MPLPNDQSENWFSRMVTNIARLGVGVLPGQLGDLGVHRCTLKLAGDLPPPPWAFCRLFGGRSAAPVVGVLPLGEGTFEETSVSEGVASGFDDFVLLPAEDGLYKVR